MNFELSYVLCTIAGFIALYLFTRLLSSPRYPYVHRHILTKAELRFFKTLRWLIPQDAYLSVKPRLGDIVDVDKVVKDRDSNWIGNFGAAVWSKHIDFVIFDTDTAEVLLCIELDDSSHKAGTTHHCPPVTAHFHRAHLQPPGLVGPQQEAAD